MHTLSCILSHVRRSRLRDQPTDLLHAPCDSQQFELSLSQHAPQARQIAVNAPCTYQSCMKSGRTDCPDAATRSAAVLSVTYAAFQSPESQYQNRRRFRANQRAGRTQAHTNPFRPTDSLRMPGDTIPATVRGGRGLSGWTGINGGQRRYKARH